MYQRKSIPLSCKVGRARETFVRDRRRRTRKPRHGIAMHSAAVKSARGVWEAWQPSCYRVVAPISYRCTHKYFIIGDEAQ